jgi:hypothetical protein
MHVVMQRPEPFIYLIKYKSLYKKIMCERLCTHILNLHSRILLIQRWFDFFANETSHLPREFLQTPGGLDPTSSSRYSLASETQPVPWPLLLPGARPPLPRVAAARGLAGAPWSGRRRSLELVDLQTGLH